MLLSFDEALWNRTGSSDLALAILYANIYLVGCAVGRSVRMSGRGGVGQLGLEEGGLLLEGDTKPADASGKRMHAIAKAGAFIAVLGDGFVNSKECKAVMLPTFHLFATQRRSKLSPTTAFTLGDVYFKS